MPHFNMIKIRIAIVLKQENPLPDMETGFHHSNIINKH